MSIYIPRVFGNIDEARIMDTFYKLDIGKVTNVDFVEKCGKNGYYYSVYIHFEYWFDNEHARNLQAKIKSGMEARVVYDDPWYWIVLENHGQKAVSGQRKLRIDVSALGLLPAVEETQAFDDLDADLEMGLRKSSFSSVQASPVQASPVQASPVQASPVQASPVQASPVQASPVQASPMQASPMQVEDTAHEYLYDENFGQVTESYDMVDSKYATQLEEMISIMRCDIMALMAEKKYKEDLMMDELQCLRNQLSCYNDNSGCVLESF